MLRTWMVINSNGRVNGTEAGAGADGSSGTGSVTGTATGTGSDGVETGTGSTGDEDRDGDGFGDGDSNTSVMPQCLNERTSERAQLLSAMTHPSTVLNLDAKQSFVTPKSYN